MVANNTYIMSLINQMLRDLESRDTTDSRPSTLPYNIKVTEEPASKVPLLVWSVLAIFATGGSYLAYQYNKTPLVIFTDNSKKAPIPIGPYETILAVPNAVTNIVPRTEQKVPENTAVQPISVVQQAPAAQTAPAVQVKSPVQPVQVTPEVQVEPEIVYEPSIKNRPSIPKSAPIKQLSAKQQADLLYRQAENNSEDYSAVYKLEQVLKFDPRHLKARLLLAKVLHNQGQISKTADFLDQSLALFPGNLQFVNTRAQLFLQQKKPNDALKTLQGIDLANGSNEIYLSLLAVTYQQLQSFTDAANVYQKLVSVNPEKAENWLGFALTQEKLGNPKFAREAYQQALSKHTLKESVTSYIKQRLVELK
ncbi:MAG: tetratricopeptide repeat protein [Methylobacter sp.]|nr:MAG: tetratricopeptide repeat protein [Methylobacter sp.]